MLKLNQVKNKIHNINIALTVIEKIIPDHSNYITTLEVNEITAGNFTERLKQANLIPKGDISDFVKKTDFDDKLKKLNKKVTSNKSKH